MDPVSRDADQPGDRRVFRHEQRRMRRRAVQTAFPDNLRARINAAQNILSNAFALALTVSVGWIGERIDYRW